MERIDNILNYAFPDSWKKMIGNYSGDGSDLQAWLDAKVTWQAAPVSAAAIIAAEPDFISWRDGVLQDRADEESDAVTIKVDPAIRALVTARPAQIETYIDNNVTDLASAKEVLKIIAKAVSVLGKREFKEANA